MACSTSIRFNEVHHLIQNPIDSSRIRLIPSFHEVGSFGLLALVFLPSRLRVPIEWLRGPIEAGSALNHTNKVAHCYWLIDLNIYIIYYL